MHFHGPFTKVIIWEIGIGWREEFEDDKARRPRKTNSNALFGLCFASFGAVLDVFEYFSLWNFLGWKFVCVAMDSVFCLILFFEIVTRVGGLSRFGLP